MHLLVLRKVAAINPFVEVEGLFFVAIGTRESAETFADRLDAIAYLKILLPTPILIIF
jgi:hypothetical protein